MLFHFFIFWGGREMKTLFMACLIQALFTGLTVSSQAEDRPPVPPPAPLIDPNFQQPPPSSAPTAPPAIVHHEEFISNMPVIKPGMSLKAESAAATSQHVRQLTIKPKHNEIKAETKSIQPKFSAQSLNPSPGMPIKSINPLPSSRKKVKVTQKPAVQEQK